jgi:hypothetical protein
VHRTHQLPVLGVRADKGSNDDQVGCGQELCHVCRAAIVLCTVLTGEAEVRAEAAAKHIAVKPGAPVALSPQDLGYRVTDRCLAGGG